MRAGGRRPPVRAQPAAAPAGRAHCRGARQAGWRMTTTRTWRGAGAFTTCNAWPVCGGHCAPAKGRCKALLIATLAPAQPRFPAGGSSPLGAWVNPRPPSLTVVTDKHASPSLPSCSAPPVLPAFHRRYGKRNIAEQMRARGWSGGPSGGGHFKYTRTFPDLGGWKQARPLLLACASPLDGLPRPASCWRGCRRRILVQGPRGSALLAALLWSPLLHCSALASAALLLRTAALLRAYQRCTTAAHRCTAPGLPALHYCCAPRGVECAANESELLARPLPASVSRSTA